MTEEGLLIVKPTQDAMFFAGEIVAEPLTGLSPPEVELDQELM
jgi:hypothetical protein